MIVSFFFFLEKSIIFFYSREDGFIKHNIRETIHIRL